jgi:hypothetical protein
VTRKKEAMREILLIVIISVLSHLTALSQANSPGSPDQLATWIQKLATRSAKATILTRRLVVYSGKIVAADEESFFLKVHNRSSPLKYADVLEFSGGGEEMSLAPELTTKPHGVWDDVNRIFPGTKILIVTVDGKNIQGLANSATAETLIFIERDHHERMDLARNRVAAVYGLVGGYGGVKKGASKGAEGMKSGRNQILDGVFAGVGALAGLAKSEGRPILVYSR